MKAGRVSSGQRRHYVTLYSVSDPQPDGDGGFTTVPVPLDPSGMYASIDAASQRDLERVIAGTVMAEATHIVTMPYHPGVTTSTLIVFNGRQLSVVGVSNPEERNIETIAVCSELVGVALVVIAPPFMQQGMAQDSLWH